MDDELLKLEAELRRLRPIAPSRRLLARLENEMEAPAEPMTREVRYAWLALPLAAAAALALMLWPASSPERASVGAGSAPSVAAGSAVPSNSLFRPVAAEDVVLHPRAESLVTLADGSIARRTSESYLATITWKNPRTNASLTWRVPREEVRVVPVSYQ